ncbi:DUF58 domain-containing protein [Microbacterium nymphoidis]|uniref:DUF58 domain-containing protein n=1 Tax=Microbacterium nymphoidis TaxID=2898586 RepID=UPI001E423104|nr:DUF58 domain-containing protein [Microbacterium nymphoidis]MCD2498326.1 DUF58 domain-containing protein [Microbacterium nymphoidis]
MASLLPQVKSKLFISSGRSSMHQLDGAYKSLLHGRSLDFEDLRRYETGDQVRDIDWRASARLGNLVVKRTRATRAQTVLFVVDTGRTMAALAEDGAPKQELSILAMGALGYLTVRHGDDVGLVSGDADRVRRMQTGSSEAALEHMLRTIETTTAAATAPGSVDNLLDFVARTIAQRMIVVVIADEDPLTERTEQLIRRLRLQHDLLWITVADADVVLAHRSASVRSDVVSGWRVPDFVNGDAEVLAELTELREQAEDHRREFFKRWEIDHTVLRNQDYAVGEILQMLNRRSRARS